MKYSGIDLFAGCGGLSLGASWAGIHIAAAAETYKQNHLGTKIFIQRIEKISPYLSDLPGLENGGENA